MSTLSSLLRVTLLGCLLMMSGCAHTRTLSRTGEPEHLQRTTNRHVFARIAMGSRCTITLEADSEHEAARAAGAAFEEIARIERVLSDWREDSEVMTLMRRDPGAWHAVSPTLFETLELSLTLAARTGGAFDPTIGVYTHLWRRGVFPSRDELRKAGGRVGWRRLELNATSRSVRFDTAGMILDFGGIGKGYAAQRALDLLRQSGHPVASVDLGGDLVVGAPPSDQPEGWRVQIVTGLNERRTLTLSNCAVATSGDLERYYEYEGVRYAHIVDPATGLGLTRRRASTVIAPDGGMADAIASAACVLGGEGLADLRASFPGVRIMLVERAMPGVVGECDEAHEKPATR